MKLERITVTSPQLVASSILHGNLPKTITIYLKLSTAILQSLCLTLHNANTDIYRRRTPQSQLSKLTKRAHSKLSSYLKFGVSMGRRVYDWVKVSLLILARNSPKFTP